MIPEAALRTIFAALGIDFRAMSGMAEEMRGAVLQIVAQQQEILALQRHILMELNHNGTQLQEYRPPSLALADAAVSPQPAR